MHAPSGRRPRSSSPSPSPPPSPSQSPGVALSDAAVTQYLLNTYPVLDAALRAELQPHLPKDAVPHGHNTALLLARSPTAHRKYELPPPPPTSSTSTSTTSSIITATVHHIFRCARLLRYAAPPGLPPRHVCVLACPLPNSGTIVVAAYLPATGFRPVQHIHFSLAVVPSGTISGFAPLCLRTARAAVRLPPKGPRRLTSRAIDRLMDGPVHQFLPLPISFLTASATDNDNDNGNDNENNNGKAAQRHIEDYLSSATDIDLAVFQTSDGAVAKHMSNVSAPTPSSEAISKRHNCSFSSFDGPRRAKHLIPGSPDAAQPVQSPGGRIVQTNSGSPCSDHPLYTLSSMSASLVSDAPVRTTSPYPSPLSSNHTPPAHISAPVPSLRRNPMHVHTSSNQPPSPRYLPLTPLEALRFHLPPAARTRSMPTLRAGGMPRVAPAGVERLMAHPVKRPTIAAGCSCVDADVGHVVASLAYFEHPFYSLAGAPRYALTSNLYGTFHPSPTIFTSHSSSVASSPINSSTLVSRCTSFSWCWRGSGRGRGRGRGRDNERERERNERLRDDVDMRPEVCRWFVSHLLARTVRAAAGRPIRVPAHLLASVGGHLFSIGPSLFLRKHADDAPIPVLAISDDGVLSTGPPLRDYDDDVSCFSGDHVVYWQLDELYVDIK